MKTKRAAVNNALPKRKPRVQREVVATLAHRILSGEIRPREYLPKESELCAQYRVSRTVIREATKILESKGLLRSRSRVGTQVLDPNEWNMLDADLLAWAGSKFHDPRFVHSLMEARFIIEPAAAELAAERADSRDLARLDEAYQRMRASLPPNAPRDVQRCSEADLDFHTALLVGSHNHVLIQLASVIRAALRALFELTTHLGSAHEQALHLHGEVVEAVRLRRSDMARAAILKILNAAVADLDLHPSRITPEALRPNGVDRQSRDRRAKIEHGRQNAEHKAPRRSVRAAGTKPRKKTIRRAHHESRMDTDGRE
jgi:GntR family transcriptional regulator, galactonate operon transcriptional repressor